MSDDLLREPDQLDGIDLPEHNLRPVIGHAMAQDRLDEIVTAGRYPSALLLSGPRGIGKATLAFGFARRLLAATGDEPPHRIDEQVLAGVHPNFFLLRLAPKEGRGFYTVIRVDEVRALRDQLHQTRGRAGYRVAIIDAIDDCNPSAANALLKTLEEPPPETIFLLVSHRPGLLLPTIRSRCLGLALRPLADEDVAQVLVAQRPDATVDRVLPLAEGRPRRGFEALALGDGGALMALRSWLADPLGRPAAAHLAVADALAGEGGGAGFARDLIADWLAGEARTAALAGIAGRRRLASANELWDKAHALFADEESLNLDARQTLVAVFDAIRQHILATAPLAEPT